MASLARNDLNDKLALERLLLVAMRGTAKRAARELHLELKRGRPVPDMGLLLQPTVESHLKTHFRRCERVFGSNLQDSFKADLKPGSIEKALIKIEIFRVLDARAERQSQIIVRTAQSLAQRAWSKAVLLRTLNPGDLTAEDLPRLTANLFLTGLTVQAAAVATTETQMGTETCKGIEAQMLVGESTIDVKRMAPTIVVAKKIWRSQGDSRVRTIQGGSKFDHLEADGQAVKHNGVFNVGGELLSWPGDITFGASIGNIIRCRCSAIYDEDSFAALRAVYLFAVLADLEVFRQTESTVRVGAELVL